MRSDLELYLLAMDIKGQCNLERVAEDCWVITKDDGFTITTTIFDSKGEETKD